MLHRKRLKRSSRNWRSSTIQTKTKKIQKPPRKSSSKSLMPMRCSVIPRKGRSTISLERRELTMVGVVASPIWMTSSAHSSEVEVEEEVAEEEVE
jgi:hypothetical protein